uniref:PID domain-containing protein n=1 Tax=Sinocyclocheilus rhinocerous TaxID=307959 RepID=A0A673KQ80_9TELE
MVKRSESDCASTVESTNHSGPILTPPTSLNLRSSHNQQLSCDTIKEGVVAVSKETQSSKSRQKYALTNIQKAMGLSQNPAPLNQSHASLDRKPEQLDLNKNDRNLVRSSWDWLEGKDNQKNPTIRRRTKSFLEYHREEEVHEHSLRPNNERISRVRDGCLQRSPLRLKLRGDEPEESPERPARPEKQEEEEDSSWTTLSQESPSVETPQETGDQQTDALSCSEPLLACRCAGVLQVFAVCYLGWLEVRDADVRSARSGAVLNADRQLSDLIHKLTSLSSRSQTQAMLLVLQDITLTLIDPADHTLLHSQPISCIRVWGGGRGFSRDFAYVARDENTRVLKCHVFQCDSPAESVTSSLKQICSKVRNALFCLEFPTPKTDLQHSFHVLYLGMTSVLRPIGMDMINGAIDSLMSAAGKEDWTPVLLNVADATITVIKEKVTHTLHFWLDNNSISICIASFMGVGRDVHTFAFIMDTGNQHFQCHVFWCEPNAGSVSEAVQSACVVSDTNTCNVKVLQTKFLEGTQNVC